jgi:large subunit ribosomal protein L10
MSTAADMAAPVQHARASVRPDKADTVAQLAEAFRTASAAVLTEYRGLSVKQITALRVALGGDTSYSVVKNTLTKLAARDAGFEGLVELLTGPTAVAFVHGDPVEAAKGLRDYAKANPQLVVKGGVLDGKPMTADEIRRLADLESREVLLGKLAGAMLASLSQAVYLLNAPLAQAARLVGALQAKAEADPSVLRGGAGTPAPAAEAPDAPADETPAAETADADPAAAEPAGSETPSVEGAPEGTAAEGVTPAETDSETSETSSQTSSQTSTDA